MVAYQFDPGAADGGVVLLRGACVAGDALDAVADQADGCSRAATADGQPGQVHVLAVSEPLGGGHHLPHQLREWRGLPGRAVVAWRMTAKPLGRGGRLLGQPVQMCCVGGVRVVVVCGHDPSLMSASRTAWKPPTVSAGRPPRARFSRSVRVRVMTAAASRLESVSSIRTERRSPARVPRVMWPRRSSRSSTLVSVVGRVPTEAPSWETVRPCPSARLAMALISEAVRSRSTR